MTGRRANARADAASDVRAVRSTRLELPAGFTSSPLVRHEIAVHQPGDDRAVALYLAEWGPGGTYYQQDDEYGWEQLRPIIRNKWRHAAGVPLLPDTEFTRGADAGDNAATGLVLQRHPRCGVSGWGSAGG